MKLSVSLPDEDVEFLEEYGRLVGAQSRSASLHAAVKLLRASTLEQAYVDAIVEWEGSGDADDWATTTADGLTRS